LIVAVTDYIGSIGFVMFRLLMAVT